MKCLGCLINLERTIKNEKLEDIMLPVRLFYEFAAAENQEVYDLCQKIKPKRTLEIGCGPGRLIEVVDSSKTASEIIGIEANKQIFDYAAKRFNDSPQVKIINDYVEDKLPFESDYFDLTINAMNIVGWQDNEHKWLEEMLRCGTTVYFTAYKKGFEEQREKIYLARGHKSIEQKGNKVMLHDCELGPAFSKSYTPKELENICKGLPATYEIRNLSTIAYSCILHKKS